MIKPWLRTDNNLRNLNSDPLSDRRRVFLLFLIKDDFTERPFLRFAFHPGDEVEIIKGLPLKFVIPQLFQFRKQRIETFPAISQRQPAGYRRMNLSITASTLKSRLRLDKNREVACTMYSNNWSLPSS